ncbi:MAG: hypothetical protein Q9M17_02575 [Mariprofundus sp.]|nr:hypothetical protein [Mariprofundus sp.]
MKIRFIAAELRIGGTGTGTSSYSTGTPITTALGTFPSSVAFDYSMRATYFISYLIKPQYEIAPNLHLYGLLGGTTSTARIWGIVGSVSYHF